MNCDRQPEPSRANPLGGKRIGLLTAWGSRLGGGVFEAVVRHAGLVRAAGGVPVVFALADRHSNEDRHRFGDCEVVHFQVHGPAQIGYAPLLTQALTAARLDCLHLHGIWMYPSRAGAVWARTSCKPYFVSPHGMLDPWILARGRWKKALARIGYERDSWNRARALHALTAREAVDIEAATRRSDSIIIPNAAPESAAAPATQPRRQDYAYLGRIHPKKNLSALIEAWEQLTSTGQLPSDATLTIAGWGDQRDVAKLETRLEHSPPSLRFAGPVFGAEKAQLLSRSRALVLPSQGEGLPMVVLEAWATGTPVLMSRQCNLPEGFAAGAALDCGTSAVDVATALLAASRLETKVWLAMSDAASQLAAGPFSAQTIAARWGAVYAAATATSPAGEP